MESLCKSNVGQVNIIPKVESPPVPRTVYEKKKKNTKAFCIFGFISYFQKPFEIGGQGIPQNNIKMSKLEN